MFFIEIKEELGMNDEENVDNDIIPEENIRKGTNFTNSFRVFYIIDVIVCV